MLYAAELTWSGQEDVEREYQRAINRMGRFTLGAFRSTPRGIVAGESGPALARALLNHCQARFTQRLCARPRDGGDSRQGALCPHHTPTSSSHSPTGREVEVQEWSIGRQFSGRIIVNSRAGALQTASEWR